MSASQSTSFPPTSANTNDESQSKKSKKINDFFLPENEDTMNNTMIAKMTAVDGLRFRVFWSSESIRKLFDKAGHKKLTKSANTSVVITP